MGAEQLKRAIQVRPERMVLLYEALGFLVIVVTIWLDEALQLPHHFLGAPVSPTRVEEALLESVFVVILAVIVMVLTWHRSKRIAQLESLLPICMICKRIREPDADPEREESWKSVEIYIHDRTGSMFSHGLCPTCAEQKYGLNRTAS